VLKSEWQQPRQAGELINRIDRAGCTSNGRVRQGALCGAVL
jgi:hypothetical protein